MKFWVDKLPKSCCEKDCPFNYDTIGCRAISFSMSNRAYVNFWDTRDYDILKECLSQSEYSRNRKRYYKCPLRLIDKIGEQDNGKNNNT